MTVYSTVQSGLLFLALSEVDTEPLLVLEFLHRVVDALEDFVGTPLLSTKIQANYEVVAQLLHEMCDAGIVCNTEPNALQEVVEMPGWMGKLLGGLSGSVLLLIASFLRMTALLMILSMKFVDPIASVVQPIETNDIFLHHRPRPCHPLEEVSRTAYLQRAIR